MPRAGLSSALVGAATMETYEKTVRDAIVNLEPAQAYTRLVEGNDALIASGDLDTGRQIVSGRTALHTQLTRHWAAAQHAALGYSGGFAALPFSLDDVPPLEGKQLNSYFRLPEAVSPEEARRRVGEHF